MDNRPRQILKQLLAQHGPVLCDHPSRCRSLLLDTLQGACEAEIIALFLTLQYGMVQELRTRVPLDETATRWAIEAWAAALGIPLPVPSPLAPSSSPPLPTPSPTGRNSIGMEFVLIHAGEFLMGSNDKFYSERPDHPVHRVRISKPFYLGQYEVTQGQWQMIMEDNPSLFQGDSNLPVEHVSWEDVQELLRKMNAHEGSARYRLPTEAEWEYAARAGTTTAYSFGHDSHQLSEYAWYRENSENKSHPVGQKKPNPWGLYDMHGNVWEWVQDWYGLSTAGTAADPVGPPWGLSRVFRGGSWFSDAWYCQSAYYNGVRPSTRNGYLGFRLLREVQ